MQQSLDSNEIDAAIENAYRVFSRYRFSGMVTVCRCGVCVSEQDARDLSTTPLRAISSSLLAEYTDSAHHWLEPGVAEEFRYFLPRYFELIAAGEVPCGLGIELCLKRLFDSGYRGQWSAAEAAAIDGFFLAYFRTRLHAPVEVGRFGLPVAETAGVEEVLCMVAYAGGDLSRLLAAWDEDRSREATLRIATMIGIADWRKRRLANSWWIHRSHAATAKEAVLQWLLRAQLRERLEIACLAESEPDAAALLSHAEGLVAGLART